MTAADNEELDALVADLCDIMDAAGDLPRKAAAAIRTLRARVAEAEITAIDAMAALMGKPGTVLHNHRAERAEKELGECSGALETQEKFTADIESQLQQVKADAERYRWLRGPDSHTEYHAAWTLGWRITDGNNPYHGKRCDTGIDAARRNNGTA